MHQYPCIGVQVTLVNILDALKTEHVQVWLQTQLSYCGHISWWQPLLSSKVHYWFAIWLVNQASWLRGALYSRKGAFDHCPKACITSPTWATAVAVPILNCGQQIALLAVCLANCLDEKCLVKGWTSLSLENGPAEPCLGAMYASKSVTGQSGELVWPRWIVTHTRLVALTISSVWCWPCLVVWVLQHHPKQDERLGQSQSWIGLLFLLIRKKP
jgi:hypothetical protein